MVDFLGSIELGDLDFENFYKVGTRAEPNDRYKWGEMGPL